MMVAQRKKHNDDDLGAKMEGYEEKLKHKLETSELNRKIKVEEFLRTRQAERSIDMDDET
jgi:hypothetical protein